LDNNEVVYRYNDRDNEIRLETFRVLSHTKCGIWIDYYRTRKFINLEKNKKFACVTFEDALDSFIKRKERQLSILTNQLNTAKNSLKKATIMKQRKVYDENRINFPFFIN